MVYYANSIALIEGAAAKQMKSTSGKQRLFLYAWKQKNKEQCHHRIDRTQKRKTINAENTGENAQKLTGKYIKNNEIIKTYLQNPISVV